MTSNLEQRLPSNRPSSTANQRSSNQVNGFLFLDDIAHIPNLDNYFIRIFLLVRSAQLSTQLQGHKSQSLSLSFLRVNSHVKYTSLICHFISARKDRRYGRYLSFFLSIYRYIYIYVYIYPLPHYSYLPCKFLARRVRQPQLAATTA
jgi:hypothetical protein